jgi:hypothetical protein
MLLLPLLPGEGRGEGYSRVPTRALTLTLFQGERAAPSEGQSANVSTAHFKYADSLNGKSTG